MRIATHTLETTTPPGEVWGRWEDVAAWPEWMEGLATATLEGPFGPGGCIALAWAGGRRDLRIDRVEPGRTLGATLGLPLARLHLAVDVSEARMGTRLAIALDIEGAAAAFWAWRLRHRLQAGLAGLSRRLARPR